MLHYVLQLLFGAPVTPTHTRRRTHWPFLACATLLLLPTISYCFSPSIQMTNTTRWGSTVFYVGGN